MRQVLSCLLRGVVIAVVAISFLIVSGRRPMTIAQADSGTLHVATTGGDAPGCGSVESPCRTLQYTINLAASGNIIKIAQGTYTGTGSAVASLQYTGEGKNLTFVGGYAPPNWTSPSGDPTLTVLDGENTRQVFEIISVPAINVTIQGLTIQNGYTSTPISYTGEYSGGGLICRNSDPNKPQYITLTITNVLFRNNRVQGSGNKAAAGGGASLYLRCRATLTDVTFDSNTVVAGNAPDSYRGGYALGGGLFATIQSDVTATRVTFTNNSATAGRGGTGVGSDGWSTPDALGGGAALQVNNVTLNQVTVIGNQVLGGSGSQKGGTGAGGGLFFECSTAWINGGTIQGNSATGGASQSMGGIASGGGIMTSDGTLSLDRLIVVNNTSIGGTGSDGGDAGGGGLYSTRASTSYAGSVTGTNVIFGDNVSQAGAGANRWGGGGAIFNQNTTLNLTHATIAQNSVLSTMQGPAIVSLNYLGSSSVSLAHTIIASHGNTGAAIIIQKSGDSGNFSYTLFYNNSGGNYGCQPGMSGCSITNTNPVPSSDPMFISPGYPNYNYRIDPLSAARDRAIGSTIPNDVYSQARPWGVFSDTGAHEYHGELTFRVYLPLIVK